MPGTGLPEHIRSSPVSVKFRAPGPKPGADAGRVSCMNCRQAAGRAVWELWAADASAKLRAALLKACRV